MRIIVERDACIGAGQCVLTEPRVFRQSEEDGMVQLNTDRPTPDVVEAVETAVSLCPARALSLEP